MSKKYKLLKLQFETLRKEFETFKSEFKNYKSNVERRDYLIRTNFFGNIKSLIGQNMITYGVYGNNTFDIVKDQIIHYDFINLESIMSFIHLVEEKEVFENWEALDCKSVEMQEIKPVETKISTTNVTAPKKKSTQKNNVNKRETIVKQCSSKNILTKYSETHKNRYFIKNIDKFYAKVTDFPKHLYMSKENLIALINLAYEYKETQKIQNALQCGKSTLLRFISIGVKCGAFNGTENGKVKLNENVLIKPLETKK